MAAQPARADQTCTVQLFAVAADTGHLVEITACWNGPGFGSAVTVDGGDWRGHGQLFGARDSAAVVLYTIDAGGALWSRRQDAPGAGFGPPVRVGEAIDWSRFASVFVARPGYLHAVERPGPIRTFRHVNWSSGGTDVAEEQPLLHRAGKPMTAVKWGGFGEAVVGNVHLRIYRDPRYPEHYSSDEVSYESGDMPPGVTGVVGHEPWLYGIDAAGDLVRLDQLPPPSTKLFKACNPGDWYVAARSSGGYTRVVAPNGRGGPVTAPEILAKPAPDRCDPEPPLEWQ